MRWHELFADLEGHARSLERAERDAEVAERTRAEVGQLAIVNRLRAAESSSFTLTAIGVGSLTGRVQQVGADWVLLAAPNDVIVPLAAVATVIDLPLASVSPQAVGAVAGRLTMSSALRAVAIDRAAVSIVLRDGGTVVGTPDRVGADFVDVAVHPPGDAPRRASVRSRTTVGFAAIGCVRRLEGR
ncbi:MAG: hypothetical protein ACRDQA_21145 [Nocardioidaceae bacterium]